MIDGSANSKAGVRRKSGPDAPLLSAQRLDSAGKHPGNQYYQTWIDLHTGEGMTNFVAWLRRTLDGATVSPMDRSRFQGIFRDVLRYELLFWEMAYQGEEWPN